MGIKPGVRHLLKLKALAFRGFRGISEILDLGILLLLTAFQIPTLWLGILLVLTFE